MPKGTHFGALLLPVGDLCASSCEAATKKQLPAFFEMQLWAPRVAAKLAGCRDSTGGGGEVIKEELGFNWQGRGLETGREFPTCLQQRQGAATSPRGSGDALSSAGGVPDPHTLPCPAFGLQLLAAITSSWLLWLGSWGQRTNTSWFAKS